MAPKRSCVSKHLGGADAAKVCFPFTDGVEAKTTSGRYQEARALPMSQSLFGALMWVPGASAQHITSAKLVKVPNHPYADD